MTRINAVLAQLTFWVVLWWGIFEWRFASWATAWPWLLLSVFVLKLWFLFSDRLKTETRIERFRREL